MKNRLFQTIKLISLAACLLYFSSCKKEDVPVPNNTTSNVLKLKELETDYVRIIIGKHSVDSVKILSFKNEKQTGYKVHSSVFSLYPFHYSRYAGIVHRQVGTTLGKTEIFDSGIELGLLIFHS